MTDLPTRNFVIKRNRISSFEFSELLDKSDEQLANNVYQNIYLDNTSLVADNLDFVNKLISLGYGCFYSKDYDILKAIEDSMKEKKQITLALLDDFQNKDRTYIQVSYFEKAFIDLPIAYSFWVDTDRDLIVHDRMNGYTLYPSNTTGVSPLKRDDMERIRELIYKLNEKCKNLDDLEKTIVISDYLQDLVQFVDDENVSISASGVYITDCKNAEVNSITVGSIPNILFNHFGVCRGIANATTVLLNNPQLNVNVRTVTGDDHAWNDVCISGKHYFIDNTWNITRNPSKYKESLKAKNFSSEFLLFGIDTALEIGHHFSTSFYPHHIQYDNFDREILDQKVKKLGSIAKYSNYQNPTFESHLQRKIKTCV